ncbi:hypothetical protein SEUCBS139899_008524 [Sporothrix eucalyptigena]
MSLNGLDDAAVREAHEAAVSEPGGWFLIKYASRDEVGLHGRGTGGIVEVRNAIAQYEEASPLYGFLRYRRRNVIIKYLPDNCSRLVQARVTVHFNAVCERFAPYNTTFSIADAKELKDTKLSAACSLHTASSSTSSSTSSLRRRRLMEIAEEEEEEQRATKRQSIVKEEDRAGAQDDVDATALSAAEVASIPVPINPPDSLDVKRPHTSGGRPTSSSGISVKSVATTATATTTKQNTITPEKARLMKAMKLREKKKKMFVQPPLPIPTVDVIEVPVETETDTAQLDDPSDSASATGISFTGSCDDRPGSSSELSVGNSYAPNTGSADSAIDIGLSAVDRISIDTRTTDSHPTSPLAMSSEIGESTKASSLSESTDETVMALQELKVETVTDAHDSSDEAKALAAAQADDVAPQDDDNNETTPVEIPVVGEESVGAQPNENSRDEIAAAPEGDTGNPKSENKAAAIGQGHEQNMASAEPSLNPNGEAFGEAAVEITDSSRPTTSTTSEFTADLENETLIPSVVVPTIAEPGPRDSQSTIGLETSETASVDTKRARRRALVDPIRTDLVNSRGSDAARSDANLSDDEELMEELQSATVQEAKPITVSKSPITPVFPNTSPSKQKGSGDGNFNRVVRTVSSPVRGSLLVPGDATASSARSVSSSAAFLQKIAQQNSANMLPKKANIGSSISQRIKALEKLSGNVPGATVEVPARVERPTSTFFSVRKTTGRDSSRSPSVAERASSLTRDKTPSPPTSRESSPEMPKLTSRDRSGSMASRLSVFENGNLPRGRPESVQVRARIIRDPMQPFPKMPDSHYDPSEPGQLHLKQSPLVVDHQKAAPSLTSSLAILSTSGNTDTSTGSVQKRESIQERRMSKEKRRSQSHDRSTIADDSEGTRPRRRSSLSIVKDFIKDRRGSVMATRSPSTDNLNVTNLASPASMFSPLKSPSRPPSVHTTHGLARRLSISSRRSTSKDRDMTTPPLNTPLSPSLMTETSGSGDESKSSASELGHKKTGSGGKNRASRFMRRLSSSLSTGRKNTTPTISPTVAEEEEALNTIPLSCGGSTVQTNVITYIGDVNVQFPDNLLWKRRTMCLDSQGFLILSTGNGVAATASGSDRPTGAVKRYHLSDFRLPYIPEMEVQELPNSVCLDFVDGSGLQVACEDRAGQLNVLQGK